MDCPECDAEIVTFEIPVEYESYLPGSESAAGLCTRCLELVPVGDPTVGEAEFGLVSDAFPTTHGAAVPMALLVGLLSNLALYRGEIAKLLEDVERAGVDPLLVLDRLATDPDVDTELDLTGRRRQLEQLI